MAKKETARIRSAEEVSLDFQSLFEAVPGLFLVLRPDTAFTIIAVSDAYLQATKTTREAIVGKGLFQVFPDNPDDSSATGTSNLRASLERAVRTKKPDTMAVQKYDIPLPSGKGFEERYWSPLNTPVVDKSGAVKYLIHKVEDVTDFVKLEQRGKRQTKLTKDLRTKSGKMEVEIYKRAQEIQTINKELQAANDKLSKLDELKTQFFTNISHEFRTPLTLMLGPLESVLHDTTHRVHTLHRKNIELAYQNALRLERLVNSLLDFSRLEAGRTTAVYRPINLAQYTFELSSNFESAIKAAGLGYDVDCEALGEPVYVDATFWEKIVLNLLSNALKHTFEGAITVTLRRSGSMAELIVKDTGTGIPAAELEHLFERFYRVKGTKSRTHEGSGIGLALVQDLVTLQGGTITVESQEGQGTKFIVRIPFGKDHLPKQQVSDSTVSSAESNHLQLAFANEAAQWVVDTYDTSPDEQPSAATVLVVDDNSDMRYYIKSVLARNPDWRILLAPDGPTALALVERHQPDIILTDIMMPQMDGHELVAHLRERPDTKNTPIIFLSARAGEEAKMHGLASGVDDYLVKPFTANELISRVKAHLALAVERRKTHADELQQLWDLNKAKDDFISLASHQLRTPTTAVKQYIGMMLEGFRGDLTPEQLDALQRAYQANERGLRIIDDLLRVAKVDAGKVTINRMPTDLVKLLREVIDEQSAKIRLRNQTISFKPPARTKHALVDAALLRMVVENLLDNASKYSAEGKHITLGLVCRDDKIKITVRDQGVGIAKTDMPRLFQKFSRVSNPLSVQVGGTGIGLYWVKKVLEVHGGDIAVTSRVGNGSAFTITLPQT